MTDETLHTYGEVLFVVETLSLPECDGSKIADSILIYVVWQEVHY